MIFFESGDCTIDVFRHLRQIKERFCCILQCDFWIDGIKDNTLLKQTERWFFIRFPLCGRDRLLSFVRSLCPILFLKLQ